MCRAKFFIGEGGALRLGLYVFHHNNNFNLINIHSAKTITIEHKKSYGSIYGVNKTIIWLQIHFLFFKSNSSNLKITRFYNQTCLSLMRTGAGVIKYAVFHVLNRFQTYSNSIDCTITKFDVLLCNFFSQCCVCNFFYALLGLCKFFFYTTVLPLPPPPPPLHEINLSVP